jgi:hypothetical protein
MRCVMMEAHPKFPLPPPPISEVLDQLLATEERVTIGEIVDRIDERGFGLLMLILGLPMLIPVLPPGASTLVGPIYSLLALRLVIGMDRPWLPGFVRRKVLSAQTLQVLRRRGVPLVRRIERFSRPRFRVLRHPLIVRLAALNVLIMGLVLLSPAPFLNTLPALSVMFIGLGLMKDDGVFLALGLGVGLVVLGLLAASVGLLVAALRRLAPWWFPPGP